MRRSAICCLFLTIFCTFCTGARAHERLVWRTYCNSYGHCVSRQVLQRVYGWNSEDDGEHVGECHGARRVVGDQHLTLDGAKKAANDAWAGTVRFHLGEKFMDLVNARNPFYTCSRSSIKEPGSSITTAGQALTRCELEAQPCAAPRKREPDDKRD